MKEEYIRKVTYAPFFSTVSKDWLSLALPMMISMDIRQDKSITTSESSHNTYLYLKKMDLENEKKLPKKIKEKIAYKNFSDYVLSGDIEGDLENGLSYIIDLYSRKTGESLVLEGVSTDIFELTDSIGNWIVESIHTNDLRTPRIKGENIHPKEFYSSDLLALEYYFKSYWKFHDGEVSGIKELMDDAIERDDKFAMAYTTRSWAYFTQGNRMAALADMDKALQYSGSLTEFQVFDVKDYYYSYNNERESRRKLLEMWVKIHPEDSHPSQQLMEHFKGGRQVVKAIAVGEAAFKRGHKDYFIIELAILYAQEGNHQKVEEYIRTYKKQFPGDTDILYRLGRIYSNEFKYEKALELFREYQTLNPRHFNTALNISMTQLQLGKIEEVESNVLKAKKFV
ncbi:MAG: tetratricopeptide repeat protein, partial [Saprospiraceae bacterium]